MANYSDEEYKNALALLVQSGEDKDGSLTAELRKMSGFNAEQEALNRQMNHLQAGLSPDFAEETIKRLPNADAEYLRRQPKSTYLGMAKEALKSSGVNLLNGASLGWADEALGTVSPEAAAEYRAMQKNSRALMPGVTASQEIIGGLPLATIPGGSGLVGSAATGAVMGGLYGAGDANEGDRLGSGLVGGATGALAGPLLGVAGKAVGAVASKAPEVAAGSKRVYNEIANLLKGETGSINNRVTNSVDGMLTPGEKYLLGRAPANNWQSGTLDEGLKQWVKTRQDIPEYTFADAIISNPKGSAASMKQELNYIRSKPAANDEIMNVLYDRNLRRSERVSSKMNDVSESALTNDDTAKPLFALRDGVNQHLDNLKANRKAEGDEFYRLAKEATPGKLSEQYPTVARLTKDKLISEAISDVIAEDPKTKFWGKDSLAMLDKAKQRLDEWGKEYGARDNGGFKNLGPGAAKRAAQRIKDTLDEINPYYKQARTAWRDASADINMLEGRNWGKQKQAGLFSKILKADDANDPNTIFRNLMSIEPSQARTLKNSLPKEYHPLLENAVLQGVKNIARDAADGGQSPIAKIWTRRGESSTKRDLLKEYLGKEKYKQVSKQLDAELNMHDTYQAVPIGSQTQPRAERAAKEGSFIANLVKSPIEMTGKGISKLASALAKPDDEIYREAARALITDQAWTSMPKIIKAMQSKEYSKELAKVLMPGAQKAGAGTGRYIAGRLPNQTEGN